MGHPGREIHRENKTCLPFAETTLGDLPAELRNSIHEFLLRPDVEVEITSIPSCSAKAPSVTQVCQRLRSETREMYYSSATFVVKLQGQAQVDVAIRWLQSIGSVNANLIRDLRIKVLGSEPLDEFTTKHSAFELVETLWNSRTCRDAVRWSGPGSDKKYELKAKAIRSYHKDRAAYLGSPPCRICYRGSPTAMYSDHHVLVHPGVDFGRTLTIEDSAASYFRSLTDSGPPASEGGSVVDVYLPDNLSIESAQLLLAKLIRLTNLRVHIARNCMLMVDWDLVYALQVFDRAEAELPAEAFLDDTHPGGLYMTPRSMRAFQIVFRVKSHLKLPSSDNVDSATAMVERLAGQTGMCYDFCVKCLVEVGWNLEAGLDAFRRIEDDLPAEAFRVGD